MWTRFFGKNFHQTFFSSGKVNWQGRKYFSSALSTSSSSRLSATRVVRNALLLLGATSISTFFLPPAIHAEEKKNKHDPDAKMIQELRKTEDQSKPPPIYRVVLTGGPCGGKSTSLSHISDRLRSLGFRVFVVPEAATIVITGGGIWKDYKEMNPDQQLAFEGNLMKTKMALENAFHAIAEASKEPSVIICDRGTMDTAAYLPRASFEIMLDEFGWNVMNIRDRRYDAVIHLVSSAIGAEKFYNNENNLTRTETIGEARDLDFKILNAWVGHPMIHIIDNSTGFDQKIKRVVSRVCQVVGAPKPANQKRKYLIANPNVDIPVKYEQFEVEQTYLIKSKDDGFNFVRRRGQNGSYHYNISIVLTTPEDDQRCFVERQISGREYVALLQQADPKCITVKKRVKCFVWNNQYFQLSTFLEPDNGLTILETESETKDQKPNIPTWLKTVHEVTEDSTYATYHIAKEQAENNKSNQQTS